MSADRARFRLYPFTPDDTGAVVEIIKKAAPYLPLAEIMEASVRNQNPRFVAVRLIAKTGDGVVVGMGQINQGIKTAKSGNRFFLHVLVRREWQNQGVGGKIYDALMAELRARNAESARSVARANDPMAVRFWQKRGHEEIARRSGGAVLPIADFNPADWADTETRLSEVESLRVYSYADLASDPNRDHKLHTLFNALLAAMPPSVPPVKPAVCGAPALCVPPYGEHTPVDFPTFTRNRLQQTDFLAGGLFLAITPDNRYIGAHQLVCSRSVRTEVLHTELTGVLPEWRRRGIALALKLRGLRFARERGGVKVVKTWNESNNAPIVCLNERLGFVREPARIDFLKTL